MWNGMFQPMLQKHRDFEHPHDFKQHLIDNGMLDAALVLRIEVLEAAA